MIVELYLPNYGLASRCWSYLMVSNTLAFRVYRDGKLIQEWLK